MSEYQDLTIDKFSGMVTNTPKGSFGQPIWLENISLERDGGYSTTNSPQAIISAPGNITYASSFSGDESIYVKTTTTSRVYSESGTLLFTTTLNGSETAAYGRGVIIEWDTTHPSDALIAHIQRMNGDFESTELNSKPTISFSVLASDQSVPADGGITITTPATEEGAAVIFEDNFDRANGGLNPSGASDWTASTLVINDGRVIGGGGSDSAYQIHAPSTGENWQQVSATVTEGGYLIFYANGTRSQVWTAGLSAGRALIIKANSSVYYASAPISGVDPVRITATTSNGAVTVNAGSASIILRAFAADITDGVGIGVDTSVSPTASVDAFRYLSKQVQSTEVLNPVVGSRQYPPGSRYGFDPRMRHFIMLYPQSYQYDEKPKLGTTLNPRPGGASSIRPIILRIPPYPGGINSEYKVIFNNPTDIDFQIYGAAMPPKRQYREFDGSVAFADQGAFGPPYLPLAVKEGTLIAATPQTQDTSDYLYNDGYMVYQAMNQGSLNVRGEPAWNPAVGSITTCGEVRFLNRGPYFVSRLFTFAQYVERVSNGPIDYIRPEVEWTPKAATLGEWAQLYAQGTPGGFVEIFRSKADTQTPFSPHSFFPAGKIVTQHAARTWVVAEGVWRSYADELASSSLAVDVETPEWETTPRPNTIYYSEPDTPWLFKERFISPDLVRSTRVVALRSAGDYLIVIGDSDGAVVAGDSEANFYVRPLDIPGGFSQETSAVIDGVVYYRGVGGIYRINGGKAEEISRPIRNLIPDTPQIVESMSVDRTERRLYVRVSASYVLCYDITAEGWTAHTFSGRLFDVGSKLTIADASQIKRLIGQPNTTGTIRYEDLDGGRGILRKHFKSVSFMVQSEGGGEVRLGTGVHRVGGQDTAPDLSEPRALASSTNLCQFRLRNRVGYALDMEIHLVPAAQHLLVKPGISIEVYGEGATRGGLK